MIPPYTIIEGKLEVLAGKNSNGFLVACCYKTHAQAQRVCFILNGYNINAGWEIYHHGQPFLVTRKFSKTAYAWRNQANAERIAGNDCYIIPHLPLVSITTRSGQELRFQKTKAKKLLIEARRALREANLTDHLSIEDYLLVTFRKTCPQTLAAL